MNKILLLTLILLILIILGVLWLSRPPLKTSPISISPSALVPKKIQYKTYSFPASTVHVLQIPQQSCFQVIASLSESLETVGDFAQKTQAIAGLNAGFFDPLNRQSTSFVKQQGMMTADPRQNERLMNNPDLMPYREKILNRTEFRRYRCNSKTRYDITVHSASVPVSCQLTDAVGAGPSLLPKLTASEEGFFDQLNGQVFRDPLGIHQPNARSAIGLTADQTIFLILVAQTANASQNSGMTLTELAEFMKNLGIQKAINLDGGSSSSLYYQGQTFYGKLDELGSPVKRPIKSALLVLPTCNLAQP